MKILILGGNGMLGHQLLTDFKHKYDVKITLSKSKDAYNYTDDNVFYNINANDIKSIDAVINVYQPDYVINCIGIIKQLDLAKEYIPSIEINSCFPHKLTTICEKYKCKLFHISTDCVFNGKDGNYTESDYSNAEDLYGRTKFLGEVDYSTNVITLRTSIIGRELQNHKSLVDWFISQNNKTVKGYTNAIYTGFTTKELGNIISMIIDHYPDAHGLYNVSSNKINKFDLLQLIKRKYSLNIEIEPYNEFYCDRSLNSDKFRNKFNYLPPSWEYMIQNM